MKSLIKHFIVLITACVLSLSIFAYGDQEVTQLTDKEKIEIIMSLAQRTEQERTFYRWQSETSGNNLLQAGELTEKIYRYFMTMTVDDHHFVMGRGIYAAEDMISSSQFIRDGKGSLIEVKLAAGIPTIDLTNPKVSRALADKGISVNDVKRLDPPVAVRYDQKGWWALKQQTGVRFKAVDPLAHSSEKWVNISNRVATKVAREVVQPYLEKSINHEMATKPALVLRSPETLLHVPPEKAAEIIRENPELQKRYKELISKSYFVKFSEDQKDRMFNILETSGLKIDAKDRDLQRTYDERIERWMQKGAKDYTVEELRALLKHDEFYQAKNDIRHLQTYQKFNQAAAESIAKILEHDIYNSPRASDLKWALEFMGKMKAEVPYDVFVNVVKADPGLSGYSAPVKEAILELGRATLGAETHTKNLEAKSIALDLAVRTPQGADFTKALFRLDYGGLRVKIKPDTWRIIEEHLLVSLTKGDLNTQGSALRVLGQSNLISLKAARAVFEACSKLESYCKEEPPDEVSRKLLLAGGEDYWRIFEQCITDYKCPWRKGFTDPSLKVPELSADRKKAMLNDLRPFLEHTKFQGVVLEMLADDIREYADEIMELVPPASDRYGMGYEPYEYDQLQTYRREKMDQAVHKLFLAALDEKNAPTKEYARVEVFERAQGYLQTRERDIRANIRFDEKYKPVFDNMKAARTAEVKEIIEKAGEDQLAHITSLFGHSDLGERAAKRLLAYESKKPCMQILHQLGQRLGSQ